MRVAALLVHLTALLVFVQLVTGGSFLIEDLGGGTHVALGYVAGVVALIAAILAWASKPSYHALRYSSTVTLLLLVVTGLISRKVEMLAHYEVAIVLFGVSVATTFYAVRWSRMPTSPAGTVQQKSAG